jgi:hypothetical protein
MPGPIPDRGRRQGGQASGEILPTHVYCNEGERWWDFSRAQFFLGWWPLLLSQEWWGHIWYGLYGSLTVCCWKEPVVSRNLAVTDGSRYPGN